MRVVSCCRSSPLVSVGEGERTELKVRPPSVGEDRGECAVDESAHKYIEYDVYVHSVPRSLPSSNEWQGAALANWAKERLPG